MIGQKKHKEAGQSIFMSSAKGLANTVAVAVTFLGTPLLYGKTIQSVQSFTASNYGYGYTDFVSFAWFCVVAAMVFFLARASIATALMMGAMALATRMF